MQSFWKKKTIVSYLLSILVFLIHITSFSNYNNEGGFIVELNGFANLFFKCAITQHAVVLFFIISGVLFYRNYDNSMFFDKLKSRIRTLVIPYLIWNTIWMLFEIFTSYTFISSYFIGREKFVLSFSNVLNAIFHYECNIPFWFIFELIFFVMISPIIDKLIKNKYIGLILVFIILILAEFNIGLPSPLFFSKAAIAYYILGGIIGRHYFEKFSINSGRMAQCLSSIIVVLCFTYNYICFSLELKIPFVSCVVNIICSLAFWYAMDLFVDKMKMHDFYSYSFAVFAMHINVSAILCKLYYLILPRTQYFAIPNFILTLFSTLIIINIFCSILKRFSPKTYSILMGAR